MVSLQGNKSSPLSDVSIPESRPSFPPSSNPAVTRESSMPLQPHNTQSPPQSAPVQSSQHSTAAADSRPVAGLISQNRYSTDYSPQYPAAENNGLPSRAAMFSTHSAFPVSRGASGPYYSDSLLQTNPLIHPYIYTGSPQYPIPAGAANGSANPAPIVNGRHSEDQSMDVSVPARINRANSQDGSNNPNSPNSQNGAPHPAAASVHSVEGQDPVWRPY